MNLARCLCMENIGCSQTMSALDRKSPYFDWRGSRIGIGENIAGRSIECIQIQIHVQSSGSVEMMPTNESESKRT